MIDICLCCPVLLLLLLVSSMPVQGDYYKTIPRFCDRNSECDTESGELCYWMYDGCSRGQCMCDPYTHREGSDGLCRTAKVGGEFCTVDDVCPDGMRCIANRCACQRGEMTSDLKYCLLPNQKLRGEECEPHFTKCLQQASYGYTDNDVYCSYRGLCECTEGYRPDGNSCRKWGIGEYGCARAFHCEGGAICVDGRCVCPTGYSPTASNTKCAKRGAFTNLPVGAVCDEINERRYCSHGLVCHRCDGRRKTICVKFLLDTRWARQTGGSASHMSTVTWSIITLLLIVTLLSCHTLYHLQHR